MQGRVRDVHNQGANPLQLGADAPDWWVGRERLGCAFALLRTRSRKGNRPVVHTHRASTWRGGPPSVCTHSALHSRLNQASAPLLPPVPPPPPGCTPPLHWPPPTAPPWRPPCPAAPATPCSCPTSRQERNEAGLVVGGNAFYVCLCTCSSNFGRRRTPRQPCGWLRGLGRSMSLPQSFFTRASPAAFLRRC